MGIAAALGLAVLSIEGKRNNWRMPKRPRGTPPGEGHTVLGQDYGTQAEFRDGRGQAANHWRVPKDPQAYARGMANLYKKDD